MRTKKIHQNLMIDKLTCAKKMILLIAEFGDDLGSLSIVLHGKTTDKMARLTNKLKLELEEIVFEIEEQLDK